MDNKLSKQIKIVCIILLIGFLYAFIKYVYGHNITSVQDYQDLMKKFGIAGPLVLTFFQALQVVIPILPGYLGCAAGAISFGTIIGFLCNYIGISVGSIIAFFLAKRFGVDLVISLFSEKEYLKWKHKLENKRYYDAFLFIAMLLPLFPDDFLCYFSGLIGMNTRKFIWIIILGKPWCILAYSILFGLIR
ncbi:TVP38/TMEM64 family protein [Oribacterium sp. WCC10]|uniref:TVP38/TMEM64 family protein n=1 Tax=Oribacterium sp. WCC10 TaxID=1855343 RepID=UPI0008DF7FE4|nr:VTT domain-containing protein [Oribacterium sp. WCC10]SFG20782.1 Uncharacterized membrane protein YdjX, TVP38/TMEM64 family, SNARE-associated domain [Oribacterium sp. WCC10]